MICYHHRQWANPLIFILGLGMIFCLTLALQNIEIILSISIALILLITGIIFSQLSIEVTDQELRWKFGLGLIQHRVKLSEIETVEITRTRLIQGWGIHLTDRGWLYNVDRLQAVAIKLKNHQQFLLGTDEPQQLVSAIEMQLNPSYN